MAVWGKFCIFAAEINERKGLDMVTLFTILVIVYVYRYSKKIDREKYGDEFAGKSLWWHLWHDRNDRSSGYYY